MCEKHLWAVNEKPYAASYDSRLVKVKKIEKMLKRLPAGKSIYSETNHMFIKTFFDVVMDRFGDDVEVIILRRNLANTLKSFIELEYLGKNHVSYDWMVSPEAPSAAIKCIKSFNSMDHYDKCIAYLIDIEARALRFQQDYPKTKVHEVRLEELNSKQSVVSLFEKLGITPTDQLDTVVGNTINRRKSRKSHFNTKTTLEHCTLRCRRYIKTAREMGIDVPDVRI
ncbi:MAG: hypothetical protein ACXADB_02395 [Candidatus Hermodarchaeia archaeon]